MIPVLERQDRDRGLHRISPAASLLVLAALVGTVLASSGVLLKAAAFGVILMLLAVSGERLGGFVRSLRFVFLFAVLLFVVQAFTTESGTLILRTPPVTDHGVLAGAAMALRFLVVLTASALFVLVTDPDRLAQTLIRAGIPYRYGYVLILALRFVPFFRRELAIVREAQKVRGLVASVRRPKAIARAVQYTFIPVLVSALSRVDSIAISMKSRSFGRFPERTAGRTERWGWRDGLAVGLCGALVGLTILSRTRRWM